MVFFFYDFCGKIGFSKQGEKDYGRDQAEYTAWAGPWL